MSNANTKMRIIFLIIVHQRFYYKGKGQGRERIIVQGGGRGGQNLAGRGRERRLGVEFGSIRNKRVRKKAIRAQ
jgi:hypothetical protein